MDPEPNLQKESMRLSPGGQVVGLDPPGSGVACVEAIPRWFCSDACPAVSIVLRIGCSCPMRPFCLIPLSRFLVQHQCWQLLSR